MTGILDRVASIVGSPTFRGCGAPDLRVLLALMLHMDARSGAAFPSVRRLADLTGAHHRDVRRYLRRLTEAGLIEVSAVGSGRRSSAYVVAPGATEHSLAEFFRPGRERGASPPPEGGMSPLSEGGVQPPGRSHPVDGGGGDDPPSGRGEIDRRGGSETPPNREPAMEPLACAPAREPSDPSSVDGVPRNPSAGRTATRAQILDRIEQHGLAHRNLFAARARVDAAVSAGLTLDDVDRLAREAHRQGQEPVGLFWRWLTAADDGRAPWQDVLVDLDAAAKERKLRQAPSARGDGATSSEPLSIADIARAAGGSP